MGTRKHRPSISVRGLSYQRLRKLAARLHDEGKIGQPGMSTAIEWLIAEACEQHGIPEETVLVPRKKKPTVPKWDSGYHGGAFTF